MNQAPAAVLGLTSDSRDDQFFRCCQAAERVDGLGVEVAAVLVPIGRRAQAPRAQRRYVSAALLKVSTVAVCVGPLGVSHSQHSKLAAGQFRFIAQRY